MAVGMGDYRELHPLGFGNHLSGFPVFVVLDRFLKGIRPQVGTMEFVLRQPLQGLGHVFIGYFPGILQALALGHFSQHAGYGYGRPAAEGLEFDVVNTIFLDLQINSHHVAAQRIAHLTDTVGVFDFTYITGALKMIHYR
jgi:hypothetical protein